MPLFPNGKSQGQTFCFFASVYLMEYTKKAPNVKRIFDLERFGGLKNRRFG